MRIADTSALYALLNVDDPHHGKARAELESEEPILIPSEIFAETVSLLMLRKGFETARAAGQALRGLPQVRSKSTPAVTWEAAWRLFETSLGRLSLPDSVVVAWCRAEDARALSFDKTLLKAAGARP